MKRRKRAVVENITYFPIVSSEIVMGISLMLLFVFLGCAWATGTMLIAHITFNLPYVIFSVLPKLRQIPSSQFEAALTWAPSLAMRCARSSCPRSSRASSPGRSSPSLLSIDDFVISYFTSQDVSNLSMTIYSMAAGPQPQDQRAVDPDVYLRVDPAL